MLHEVMRLKNLLITKQNVIELQDKKIARLLVNNQCLEQEIKLLRKANKDLTQAHINSKVVATQSFSQYLKVVK